MMMGRWIALLFCLVSLGACRAEAVQRQPSDTSKPRAQRIVSLDYCADQFVLKLADKERILALSPDAERKFSYMRASAAGHRTVRPTAEDVIALKPDLVVRSYGGGPHAQAWFERAGIPVLNVGWVQSLEDIKTNVMLMARGLDAVEAGEAVVAEMEQRLAQIDHLPNAPQALYMTPSGTTSGPGTLVHEMLLAAGYSNFQTAPGWRSLPLEDLIYDQPDVVAAAFFDIRTNHPDAWSSMRHPVAQQQLARANTVHLEGAWTSCDSWFLLDAIEALARARSDNG